MNNALDEVRVKMDPKKRTLLFAAIFVQMVAQQFMTNGLSASAATMLEELNGFAVFGLVFCFANMATAAINPIAGKLSDFIDKKTLLIIGTVCNMYEYLGCGFSPNVGFLLSTRIIGGIGTGLLYVVGLSMVADFFPAKERPKYMGISASCGAVASCVGPVVAGLCSDYATWRLFPVIAGVFGIISFVLILIYTPKIPLTNSSKKVDVVGTITLAIALVLVTVVLNLVGKYFQWTDPICLVMIAVLIVAVIIFVIDQKKQGDDAIIPGKYLKNKFILVAVSGAFFAALGAVAINSYIATYAQTVMGVSATVSALPMTIGNVVMIFGATIAGTILGKKGCYKQMAIVGMLLFTASLIMCSTLNENSNIIFFTLGIGVVFGLGGSINQVVNLALIQRFLPASQMPIASGIVQTAQMIASVLSMCLLSAVMNTMQYSGAAFITVFVGIGVLILLHVVVVLVKLKKSETKE